MKSSFECNICKQKFCSEDCLISHSSLYHQSNISSPIMSHSLNLNNSFIINKLSPFLVRGIYNNKEINYDKHFSLDNLILINLKGNPQLIGNGSFGKVYLAKNKIDNKLYAIKHMIKSNLIKYLNNLEQIYNEINIQSRAYHPNIIQLFYVKETEESFDLVLEYSKYGTLFDYMLKCKGLNENLVFKFFIQIVNAIKFLHENNVIHRDIKPENILLFDNYIVKLCDFGWSVKCESRLPGGTFSGTIEYMAPELINNDDYGKEIDIWMLGILLYELVHCFSPFRPKKQKFEEKELIENIKNHEILFYMPCSNEYKELVLDLLESDMEKRLTIDDIYNSKFVKKYEKEQFYINDNKGNYSSEENENNNSFYTNDKVNKNVGDINENNMINKKKNLLLNSYKSFNEFNEHRKIMDINNSSQINKDNQNDDDEKITIIKRKESNKITRILNKNFDIYEEKDSSPKNNNRNKKIKNKAYNSENSKLSSNSNNHKEKEISKNEGILFDSIKDYKKENLKDNDDFNLMVKNNFLNNNFQKIKKYNQKQFKNNQLDRSEENIKIQNIQITNYIFNNKDNKDNKDKVSLDISDEKKYNLKEENKRCLTKKLSMNQKNQILSLSLVPGNVDYNLLLNHSPSNESRLVYPKDKDSINDCKQLNNIFINSTIQESQKNINNEMHKNNKEFPFDNFISNSSMNIHIQKTIFNNKMIKIKRLRNVKKKEGNKNIEIQDKEPNDNMRRRNNKIRNEMPLDNLKKEKDKEKKKLKNDKVKPMDNYLKTENINNKSKNNVDLKKINKYTNKENINKMNIDTEINHNNFINDKKNKRNYSVRNNIFREQKKKIYSEINANNSFRNNNESRNMFNKNNVLTNKIIKVEKISENNKDFDKNKDLNNLLIKTKEVKNFREKTSELEIDEIKNRNIYKTSRSVNKKNEFRFNKSKEKDKSIKSSKNIIKEQKKLSKIKKITKINTNIINEIDINNKNENIKNNEENKNKNFDNNGEKLLEMKSMKNNELNQREPKNLDNKLIYLKEKNNSIKKDENENVIDNNKKTKKINIGDNEIQRNENHVIENNIKENYSKDVIIKENNQNKNTGNNKKEEKFKVIIEKEIIEDKYDNFKVKEIYRSKEFIKSKNNNSSKSIKKKIINNKENNFEKNIRFSDIKNKNNKLIKRESNEKNRDSLRNNKPYVNFKQKKGKKELKLSLDNIKQNLKDNFIIENKTPRLNFGAKRKLSDIIKQKIKLDSHFAYPKKIGSDINSSNSSIYEYDKPEIIKENNTNLSNKKKINFSNSDSKVTKYTKNHISNIKKIKAFSEINCDNDTNNYISKNSNVFKNFEEQNEFEFKIEKSINQLNDNINDLNLNKEENQKKQNLKKMHKNKTDISLNKNLEINKFNNNKQIKKLKKKNSNINKKINKIIKTKYYNSKNNKPKNIKKRYRKSLTESEKDKNEKKGNDSESFIIEGDSEYGDANVF